MKIDDPERYAMHIKGRETTYRGIYGLNNQYPADLTKNQIVITTLSYIGLCSALFLLMAATAHIPGADIASQFLKE